MEAIPVGRGWYPPPGNISTVHPAGITDPLFVRGGNGGTDDSATGQLETILAVPCRQGCGGHRMKLNQPWKKRSPPLPLFLLLLGESGNRGKGVWMFRSLRTIRGSSFFSRIDPISNMKNDIGTKEGFEGRGREIMHTMCTCNRETSGWNCRTDDRNPEKETVETVPAAEYRGYAIPVVLSLPATCSPTRQPFSFHWDSNYLPLARNPSWKEIPSTYFLLHSKLYTFRQELRIHCLCFILFDRIHF